MAKARRLPLVLPFNGASVEDLLFSHDGVEQPLFFGAFNYWFLREWASWSLGQDCHETADIPFGRASAVRVYDPDLDMSIPSVREATFPGMPMAFSGKVELPGHFDKVNFAELLDRTRVDPHQIAGVWVGEEPLNVLPRNGEYVLAPPGTGKPLRAPSAYQFYASHAFFYRDSKAAKMENNMPLLPTPIVPFEITTGRVVYRRSVMDDDELDFEDLVQSGYVYRYDRESSVVTYTNSVAVCSGYPPVAEALDLPRLDLEHLPSDLNEVVENDHMRVPPEW